MGLTRSILMLVVATLLAAGCQGPGRLPLPEHMMTRGELGLARRAAAQDVTDRVSDRRYLLDRMRLGVLAVADGYPGAAQTTFEEIYEILRTQGINRDKTVASVAFYEGVRFWKGEPFEQALALAYYSTQQAMLGQWDNARAAAGNSLFYLRDFGRDAGGQRINTLEIARRAAEHERGQRGPQPGDYIDHGYVVRESNFTLGYLLAGLANQQLQRPEEASDYFRAVTEIDSSLVPLTEELRTGAYNTVLVIGYGLGPQKVTYGPDESLARFAPRTPSDGRPLIVGIGGETRVYPVVTDVNAMAADHMWNNLEDVRKAKSVIGTGLMVGGLGAAAIGSQARSDEAVYAGLGAAVLGLALKAGSAADRSYCDAFPQRFYVVPLRVEAPDSVIMLQIEGVPASRLLLTGLMPPRGGAAQLRYVHLVGRYPGSMEPPPNWAVSGRIYYGNDGSGHVVEPALPWILGGRDMRSPSENALELYRDHGYLRDVTPAELEELYRLEGMAWDTMGGYERAGRHVFEGGKWLVAPMGGTTGFVRLFGQEHPPYQPRSQRVGELAERVRAQGSPADEARRENAAVQR